MESPAYTGRAEVRLVRGWVPWGLLFGIALVVVARFSPLFDEPDTLLAAFALAGTGLAGLAATVRLGVLYRTGAVRLDRDGLSIDGALVLDGLREGDHVSRGTAAHVTLSGRQGTALLRVATRLAGEEALAAAGLGAGKARTYVVRRAGRGGGAALGAFVLLLVGAFTLSLTLGAHGVALAAPLVGAAIATAIYLTRRDAVTLRVGADGLVLIERREAPRFVPYASLQDVDLILRDAVADGLVLRFTDGSSRALSVPSVLVNQSGSEREEPARPLRERLLEAKRAAESESLAEAAGALATTLDQGARSIPEWVRDLRGALQATPSYRTAPVSRAALTAVLRDGAAAPRTRVAAAIALAATERDTLREAATGCADEALAKRLRVAADEESEAALLEAALAECERVKGGNGDTGDDTGPASALRER